MKRTDEKLKKGMWQLGMTTLSKVFSNGKRDTRFNYYWDWNDFSIGLSIAKPNKCTGWNWYVSLDLTFLSVWVYF